MKRIIAIIGIVGVTLIGCGPEKADSGSSLQTSGSSVTTQPIVEAVNSKDNVVMMVAGFACPICANKLDKQMYKITGVKDVIIDLGTGMVEVVVDKNYVPNRKAIQQAVDDAGFTLESVTFPD
ncbi:MAG: heavy-metal-associated domain-containing protein [Planctomycetes bacterium]|nr:heavy-metal-associated domain-containing protein [Planctomycetota bacterium]